jgi:hypothetical protein
MKLFNFLIYAPTDKTPSGGQIVLYALNDYLNNKGHNSKIVIFGTKLNYDIEKTIVIYPEIIANNPLNAKNVIRWLLNTTGVITQPKESTWSDNDFIYTFSKAFTCDKKINGTLRILDYKLDFFVNENKERKIDCAYLVYKGNRFFKEFNQHPLNAPKIDGSVGSLDLMKEIFNSTNFLISYDNATYFNVAAVLCGCNVIVIPDKDISQHEWGDLHNTMKCGVAYGYNNLKHAIETKSKTRDHLMALIQEDAKTIDNFISDCATNFNI